MKKKATKSISVPVHYVKGDKVWLLDDAEVESGDECTVCLGDGTLINSKGKKVKCSYCMGNGKISGSKWVTIECIVKDVRPGDAMDTFYNRDPDSDIQYFVKIKDEYEYFMCYELFDTKEAAEKEAKKLNKNV
jgi:hypothetical protein